MWPVGPGKSKGVKCVHLIFWLADFLRLFFDFILFYYCFYYFFVNFRGSCEMRLWNWFFYKNITFFGTWIKYFFRLKCDIYWIRLFCFIRFLPTIILNFNYVLFFKTFLNLVLRTYNIYNFLLRERKFKVKTLKNIIV